MSDLKDQLIRLGSTNPRLRQHLRPILEKLASSFEIYGLEYFNNGVGVVLDAVDKGIDRTRQRDYEAFVSGIYENFKRFSPEAPRLGRVEAKLTGQQRPIVTLVGLSDPDMQEEFEAFLVGEGLF